ncbi:cytochrome c biogenesis CcdA family protein [Brevibacterium album]|uniref:cytochrome c biogenesis CcdA family protein n=1 Tax=Brevibacterium album TaxID=417948 RepID=UPI000403452C|nr:cytochrome c biogenesis protein CcdA [Brevibacterium album]
MSITAHTALTASAHTTSLAEPALLAAGVGEAFAQTVLSGPLVLAVLVAAAAGMVSFASPCVLPLVPGYVGYVTGLSGTSLEDRKTSRVVLGVTLFVLGFAVVFVVLGAAFSTIGLFFAQWTDIVIRVLGLVVILAGVVFMGGIPFLQRNAQTIRRPRAGLAGAPVLGAVFALSWAPCMGPTLAAVLALSTSFGTDGSVARGTLLTFVYCLGLGIPFIVVSILIHKGMGRLEWVRRHQQAIMRAGGIMLILLGLLLLSGLWTQWIGSLQGTIAGFEVVI